MDQLEDISLEEFLRRPNPVVKIVEAPSLSDDELKKKKSRNPSSKNPSWRTPKETREWAKFNLETFNTLYSETLQQVLGLMGKFNDYPTITEFPFCEIWDEDCLEALLVRTSQSIIHEALVFAQTRIQRQNSLGNIYMAKGAQAELVFPSDGDAERGDKRKLLHPDWAGIHKEYRRNMLPGDTKLAHKFQSSSIVPGPVQEASRRPAWLWPLRQVFTYCIRSNARYGFLITDEELVAIRICRSDSNDPPPAQRSSSRVSNPRPIVENGVLEYKSIPWSHNGDSDEPTINLTLWWLHMMVRVYFCTFDQENGIMGLLPFESKILDQFYLVMIGLTEWLYMKAARNGDLDKDDHTQLTQGSNGQGTQGSATTLNGLDSEDPRTPNMADLSGTDSQRKEMSFLSNTSEARQALSRTTISDGDGDASPTKRSSRKRGRESEPKESAKRTKRGAKKRN